MICRTLAAAAVAALLMAPAAAAQITEQPRDTAHANAQDTVRAGVHDSLRAHEGHMQQPGQAQRQPDQIQQPGQMQRPGQMQQPAQAQRPGQAGKPMAAGGDMPVDTTFLAHAVSGNIKEVRLGELAGRQADDNAVKTFGKQMVTAHRKAYQASREIADTMNVGSLDSMTVEDQAIVDRFRNLQGEAFDSAYMTLMVQAHAKEVASYRNQVQFGEDPAIRRYALQTLPTLRDHFELAQRTARDIGVQVQTPLAGEMEAGANDTTAYMAPGRDSALAPADTSFMPADSVSPDTTMMPRDVMPRDTTMMPRDSTIMPQRDTTLVPGENVPRQAGTPETPVVRPAQPMPGVMGPPSDTTSLPRPTPRDSTP